MKTCNYLIQSKRCVICYEPIGIEEYEYSITKPKTVNKKKIPSETLYFHRRCYDELYHPTK